MPSITEAIMQDEITALKAERDRLFNQLADNVPILRERDRYKEALEEIDAIHVSDTLNQRKWEKAYFRFKKIARTALEVKDEL